MSQPGNILRVARGTTFHHRVAVTSVDKLAVPAVPSGSDVATGGSLASGSYNCTYAAGNRYGSTTVPAVANVVTSSGNTHVFRATLSQVASAEWYDLFCSTAANPLWVARVTEAQRAAGCTITAVGTVSGTSPGSGLVDIQVVGTGVASNAAPFTANNAYTPQLVTALALPAGYLSWEFTYVLAVTDLRSAPSLVLTVWKQNPTTLDYCLNSSVSPTILSAIRGPLIQATALNEQGNPGIVVLVDTITGQGASVDVYATPLSAP